MSNIVIPVPSLIQGVSQQPARLRYPTQCEIQENAYPSAVDGLQKRQPMKHLARCFDGGIGDPLVHVIDRGDTERYAVVVAPSTEEGASGRSRLRVFDLNTGAEKTVNGPGATPADFTYLQIPQTAPAVLITDYEFRVGTDWLAANNVAFGTQVATIPPLGTRFGSGANPTTHVYRVGNSGASAASYTTNSGTEWPAVLNAAGVTFSCFFHRDTASSAPSVTLRLRTNGANTHDAVFSISPSGAFTAAVTSTVSAVGRVDRYPNGWFRLSVTYVPTAAEVGQSARASVVFPAGSAVTLLAWGSRFDTGPAPLDWMPKPSTHLQALTVADYTFLLNSTRGAYMLSSTSPEDPNESAGFVFVAAGNYKTNYTVTLKRAGGSEQTVSVSTWDGTALTALDRWTFDCTASGTASTGVWQLTVYDTTVTYTNDISPTPAEVEVGLQAAIIAAFPHWNTNLFSILHNGTGSSQGPLNVLTMVAAFAGQQINASKVNATGGAATLTHDTGTELTSIKTDDIATALVAAINLLGDGWAATAYGSVLKVTNSNGHITKVECGDSVGNTNLFSIWSKVPSFDVLPTICEHGHVITIAGDPVAAEDDYYVKFVAEQGSGVGKGVWVETLRPTNTGASDSTQTTLDSATMPHQLVRMADGTFEFGPVAWLTRTVGDNTNTPVPSFVSDASTVRYIDGMFFWKGRLGFISGQNVLMSEVNVYFNFFRTTSRALLDSDRIDTSVQHTRVVHLRHAAPFDDALFLFSEHAQFRMSSGDVLSPRTAQVAPVLEYTTSSTARPLVSARGIFFGTARGDYAAMQQLVGAPNTSRVDALDVSAHVPRYIPGAITTLIGSDTESMVTLFADGEPSSLFIYKYHDVDQERLQSAWHKYTLGDNSRALGGGFIGSTLYLVVQRYYGVTLEAIRCAPGETDGSLGYLVALDRRFDAGPYTAVPGVYTTDTVWTLPYPIDPDATVQVARQDTGALVATAQSTDGSNVTTVTAAGVDLSAVKVYIGCSYTMRYRPTEPVLHETTRGGSGAIVSARVQAQRARLAYSASQYVKVTVTPELRPAEYATLDLAANDDGDLHFRVGSNATRVDTDITNDTHRPSNLTSLEWECLYLTRSARTPS